MTRWRWALAVCLLVLMASAFQAGQAMAPEGYFSHPDLWRDPPVEGVGAEICGDVSEAVSGYLESESNDINPTADEYGKCWISVKYLGRNVSIVIQHSPGGASGGGFPKACVEEAYKAAPLAWDIVSGIVVCSPDLPDEGHSSTFFVSRNLPLMSLVLDSQDVLDNDDLNQIVVTTLIESIREAE